MPAVYADVASAGVLRPCDDSVVFYRQAVGSRTAFAAGIAHSRFDSAGIAVVSRHIAGCGAEDGGGSCPIVPAHCDRAGRQRAASRKGHIAAVASPSRSWATHFRVVDSTNTWWEVFVSRIRVKT